MLHLRQCFAAAAALLVLAMPARGQTAAAFPSYEISGGYQLLVGEDQTFPFGLNLDGAININEALGIVGEIGWAMGSEDDIVDTDLHAFNIGVGPRFNARPAGRIWPFVQVLAGALHARASAEVGDVDISLSDTRFMLQPGGGINFVAGDGWGIVIQGDYRRVFLDEDEDGESGANQFRLFVGGRMILD